MLLMRTGDLRAATEALQRGLRRRDDAPSSADIEGEYDHLPDVSEPVKEVPEPQRRRDPDSGRSDDEFRSHRFAHAEGAIDYKLFVPNGLSSAQAPLILMLHGCTQSPDDFARGTRMNAVARQHGYIVAYPAQPQSRNASKCWNWFRSQDQQRGGGEPGLIAELTRDIIRRYGLDERRVYVAGLSAGGAMAAVLGRTYPDVFAAIGVHSGLPFGAAHDLPSAFAAMKQGGGGSPCAPSSTLIDPLPAIVFHGDRDTTVKVCNGTAIITQCTEAHASASNLRTTVERGAAANGRSYTRTSFLDSNDMVVAEQWVVHGAGHAWSGGDSSGSFTDPSGPDASEQMVRFFSAISREAMN